MIRFLWRSDGEEATVRFGRALGASLAGPAWIGLRGPLGAGKTRVAQGVAAALGYTGRVRSPSFVLEHRYRGRLPILHVDLYRLEESAEDLEAGWEESEAVVLVEWAERAGDPPPGALAVRVEPAGGDRRWIELSWPAGGSPLRDLRLEGLRSAVRDERPEGPGPRPSGQHERPEGPRPGGQHERPEGSRPAPREGA